MGLDCSAYGEPAYDFTFCARLVAAVGSVSKEAKALLEMTGHKNIRDQQGWFEPDELTSLEQLLKHHDAVPEVREFITKVNETRTRYEAKYPKDKLWSQSLLNLRKTADQIFLSQSTAQTKTELLEIAIPDDFKDSWALRHLDFARTRIPELRLEWGSLAKDLKSAHIISIFSVQVFLNRFSEIAALIGEVWDIGERIPDREAQYIAQQFAKELIDLGESVQIQPVLLPNTAATEKASFDSALRQFLTLKTLVTQISVSPLRDLDDPADEWKKADD